MKNFILACVFLLCACDEPEAVKTDGVHKIVVPKNDLRNLSGYYPWTPSDSRRTRIPGPAAPKPAEGK